MVQDFQSLIPLKVSHTQHTPVFVIGLARSGTTMLVRLIRKYFQITFGPESQFIERYYNKLSKYGDLEDRVNIAKLLYDISNERYFRRAYKNFNFTLNTQAVLRDLSEKSYTELLDKIFMQFARQQNMKRWGDKTPSYINCLPVLEELFPNAQYVHIVRDGRDVALSGYQMHFGAKNAYVASKKWKQGLNLVEKFSKQINASRFIQFRYEDLLVEPLPIMQQLMEFFKIDDDQGDLHTYLQKHIPGDIKEKNFLKWKSQFSEVEKRIFEQEAGDYLKKYFYPTEYAGLPAAGRIRKMMWEVDNHIKKNMRMEYWKDNFYKLTIKRKSIIG